jgi:SsrA-binding protein
VYQANSRVRFTLHGFCVNRFEGIKMAEGKKTIVQNRKARHDYFIEETIEAGIELYGTEVKSLRLGKANLQDSYATIKNGEVFVNGLHISPYDMGNRFNHDPMREKKLLLHRHEINRLSGLIQRQGLTLVPLSLYFKRGMVKVELAVAKGKKLYDKREALAKKDAMREIDRRMKNH